MNSAHLSPVPSPDDRNQRAQLAGSILYQVNSVLPDTQQLVTVEPKTPASDALAMMKLHGYSQLPVVQHGTLFGVFSHRSFADGVLELSADRRLRPEELPVMDFLESLTVVDPKVDIGDVLDRLDLDNAVLVGRLDRLVGVATPMDALRFFVRVTNAFLLVQEIERAIRILLHEALKGGRPFTGAGAL